MRSSGHCALESNYIPREQKPERRWLLNVKGVGNCQRSGMKLGHGLNQLVMNKGSILPETNIAPENRPSHIWFEIMVFM